MKIDVLKISFDRNGKDEVISPALITSSDQKVLVDCGYPGFLSLVEKALQEKSESLQNITRIIITHHDVDHIGALHEIKTKYPHIRIAATAEEAAYINGTKKFIRLQQAEALQESLPNDKKAAGKAFQQFLKTLKPVTVDNILETGEEIPFLPGVRVIHTPGHLPGHISLFIEKEKTLIAGDALVVSNDTLDLANPQYTVDMAAALDSVKAIANLQPEKIICFHGDLVENNMAEQLQALFTRYGQ
ncbi:MAG: MBL fold metallo-hydrolase [Flavisolibacter sp.]